MQETEDIGTANKYVAVFIVGEEGKWLFSLTKSNKCILLLPSYKAPILSSISITFFLYAYFFFD